MPAITEENRKWWTLGAMCFALFMVMLDNTVVNIALPAIQTRFDATLSNLSWAVNAYTLVFGVLLVTGGRLGDVFGRKRMFIGGIVVFTLGSIGAGLSQSINELIFFRGLQGAGAAFLMPGSLSIITNTFKGSERGRALGLWAGISGLALGMGPVVGGVLVEKAGWEWIFFLNVPVAMIAIPVTMYAVKESRDETAARRIDWVGILTLSLGLGLLLLAVVQANDYGWTSTRTLTEFAIAAVGLVAFGVSQWKQAEPMLDLNFFRDRNFNAGNVTAFLVTFSMFATFFFVTIYMQRSLGLSPIETGVRFLPMTILIIVAAPIAGKASDKYGSRWLLATGMSLVAASLFLESRITDTLRVSDAAARVHPGRHRHRHDHVADDGAGDGIGRPHKGRCCIGRAFDDAHGRWGIRRRIADGGVRSDLGQPSWRPATTSMTCSSTRSRTRCCCHPQSRFWERWSRPSSSAPTTPSRRPRRPPRWRSPPNPRSPKSQATNQPRSRE